MNHRYHQFLPIFSQEIVHHNQNGFIKGKSIFDAFRTIDDILELAETTKRSGILVAIDFEKAFDSLNHSFPSKFWRSLK